MKRFFKQLTAAIVIVTYFWAVPANANPWITDLPQQPIVSAGAATLDAAMSALNSAKQLFQAMMSGASSGAASGGGLPWTSIAGAAVGLTLAYFTFETYHKNSDGTVQDTGTVGVQFDPADAPVPVPNGWTTDTDGTVTPPPSQVPIQTVGVGETEEWLVNGIVFGHPEDAAQFQIDMRDCAQSGTTYCITPAYDGSTDQYVNQWYGDVQNNPDADYQKIQNWVAAGRPYQGTYVQRTLVSVDDQDTNLNGQMVRYYTYNQQASWQGMAVQYRDWYVATSDVPVTTTTCATGYSIDSSSTTCTLTSPAAYGASTLQKSPNGCIVHRNNKGMFYTLPGDPNCANIPGLTVGSDGSIHYNPGDGGGIVATPQTDGSLDIKQAVPDPGTNVTQVLEVHATAPGTQAGSPPVIDQVTNNYYSGTQASPLNNTAATPLPQVQVSNPGQVQNINGNVTVTNPVQIANDGHTEADLPDGASAAASVPAASGFFDPLKSKLSGFTNWQAPAHTSQCPAIGLNFDFGLNVVIRHISISDSSMCNLLENNKAMVQGVVTLIYVIGAILIVLGA